MPNKLVGTIVVEREYPDDVGLMEALEDFGEEFNTDPEIINGKVFVGICDGCAQIILEGEVYSESDEEEIRCSVCIDKNQQELAQEQATEQTPGGKPSIQPTAHSDLVFAASEDPEDQ